MDFSFPEEGNEKLHRFFFSFLALEFKANCNDYQDSHIIKTRLELH